MNGQVIYTDELTPANISEHIIDGIRKCKVFGINRLEVAIKHKEPGQELKFVIEGNEIAVFNRAFSDVVVNIPGWTNEIDIVTDLGSTRLFTGHYRVKDSIHYSTGIEREMHVCTTAGVTLDIAGKSTQLPKIVLPKVKTGGSFILQCSANYEQWPPKMSAGILKTKAAPGIGILMGIRSAKDKIREVHACRFKSYVKEIPGSNHRILHLVERDGFGKNFNEYIEKGVLPYWKDLYAYERAWFIMTNDGHFGVVKKELYEMGEAKPESALEHWDLIEWIW